MEKGYLITQFYSLPVEDFELGLLPYIFLTFQITYIFAQHTLDIA